MTPTILLFGFGLLLIVAEVLIPSFGVLGGEFVRGGTAL